MEIQVLNGEIFILLQWCPVVLLYLWACHRLWHKSVYFGVHNSAVKHQLQAERWPKRVHVRNAYLQMVEFGGQAGKSYRFPAMAWKMQFIALILRFYVCPNSTNALKIQPNKEKLLTLAPVCTPHLGPSAPVQNSDSLFQIDTSQ